MGVERAHANGQAVDALLQAHLDGRQLAALLGNGGRLTQRACAGTGHADLHAGHENACKQCEHAEAHQRQGQRVREVKVARAPLAA